MSVTSFGRDLASAVRDRLVEKAQAVAKASTRGLADLHQGGLLERDLFRAEHVLEVARDELRAERLQVELEASRQDRHRKALRIRGGEDELHVLGRLFERLQHRIERMPRKHVHLVDDVDLEAPGRRHVLGGIEKLAHLVHLGIRRGIHLEEVDEAPGVDLGARPALSARMCRDSGLAVDRLGENPRERGLADSTRSRKEICVVQALRLERIHQRR
jgi:hypothetical protein